MAGELLNFSPRPFRKSSFSVLCMPYFTDCLMTFSCSFSVRTTWNLPSQMYRSETFGLLIHFFYSSGCTLENSNKQKRFYACRIVGCHRNHRHSHWNVTTSGSASARSRTANSMLKSIAPNRFGDNELRIGIYAIPNSWRKLRQQPC